MHAGIKRSPYEAMFSCAPKVGLASTSLSREVYMKILEEDRKKYKRPQFDLVIAANPSEAQNEVERLMRANATNSLAEEDMYVEEEEA